MAAESGRTSQRDFKEQSHYVNGFLYYQNIWLVYGVTIALFAAAAALGSWLGRRLDVYADDKAASQFNAIQGAILCTSGDPHGPDLPEWPAANRGEGVQVMRLDVNSRAEPEGRRERYLFLDPFYSN